MKALIDEDSAMLAAISAAKKSGCPRAQVGAVVVGEIHATSACNGNDSSATCYTHGCVMENGHCVRYRHAEDSAIYECYAKEILLVAVTHSPCITCFGMLLAENVPRIIFLNKYRYDEFLLEATKRGLLYEVKSRLFQYNAK